MNFVDYPLFQMLVWALFACKDWRWMPCLEPRYLGVVVVVEGDVVAYVVGYGAVSVGGRFLVLVVDVGLILKQAIKVKLANVCMYNVHIMLIFYC